MQASDFLHMKKKVNYFYLPFCNTKSSDQENWPFSYPLSKLARVFSIIDVDLTRYVVI
jgi:hypothetical protein